MVALLLLVSAPNVVTCNWYLLCCALLYVHFRSAIILIGKRELIALLSLFSWCLVIVVWLFLAVSWVCLQFVIFPDHTHLIFLNTCMLRSSLRPQEVCVPLIHENNAFISPNP